MSNRSAQHQWMVLCLCLLCLFAAGPFVCSAADKDDSVFTLDVIGTGSVENEGGIDAANHAAIDNAILLAVDEALQKVVPSDILAANFADIDRLVADVGMQCIMNYQVVASAHREGVSRALVRVTVSADRIRREVVRSGILLDRDAVPSVLVLVDGTSIASDRWFSGMDGDSIVKTVADAIEKSLEARGMKKAEETLFGPGPGYSDATAGAPIDGLVAAGERVGADFVVACRIGLVRSSSEADRAEPPRISMAARVVGVDKRSEIFSASIELGGKGEGDLVITPQALLSELGVSAARELSPAIVSAWQRQSGGIHNVTITVRGVDYIAQLNSFQSLLESLRQVREVKVSEMGIDEAVLSVKAAAGAEKIASTIDKARGKGFFVNVVEASDGTVNVELISDGH